MCRVNYNMVFLGIDPGTVRLGYGCIKKGVSLELVSYGVIGDASKNHIDRLSYLGGEVRKLIKKYKPDVLGIEQVYFSKNKKTALSIAEARGVVLFVASSLGVPVLEFSPSDIKRVVAGDGRCDKKALTKIVAMTLGEKEIKGHDDASDALAIAIRASFEKVF